MIVGTNYLHGFYAILPKSTSEKTIDSKEIHKLRNGAIVSMCLSLKENWTRYPCVSCELNIHLKNKTYICNLQMIWIWICVFILFYNIFIFYNFVSETSSRHFSDICPCSPWLVCFAVLVTMYRHKKIEKNELKLNSNIKRNLFDWTEETIYLRNHMLWNKILVLNL